MQLNPRKVFACSCLIAKLEFLLWLVTTTQLNSARIELTYYNLHVTYTFNIDNTFHYKLNIKLKFFIQGVMIFNLKLLLHIEMASRSYLLLSSYWSLTSHPNTINSTAVHLNVIKGAKTASLHAAFLTKSSCL